MRNVLTGNTLFVTVAMARQASEALVLVVEGEDDQFLIKPHHNSRDVLMVSGSGGKKHVLEASILADRAGISGVRFVVDADYDRFVDHEVVYPPNVITSKGHDLVADVIFQASNLVDRVIDSHSRASRRNGATFDTQAVRAAAVRLAARVSPLRVANEAHGFGLRLRDFPFGKLTTIDPTPLQLAALAIGRTHTDLVPEAVAAEIEATERLLSESSELLVGDHDFFAALARVLKDEGITVGADALWTSFLTGMLCAHLGVTDWYISISAWGAENEKTPFQCPCAA